MRPRIDLMTNPFGAKIAKPMNTADVQAAVRLAAGTGVPVAVRGGGHSFARFSTGDGAVIDLSGLADVRVTDKERHVVRIGGGATWGQVADALAPHGLAISSGDTRSVGVGGLTLGGGIGWKVRKYGLALDQLVGVEMVIADGSVLDVSAESHPELFWAIRGGGGNFGVVTAFEFRAHPTTDVFHGRIAFPADETAGVLQGWADHMRTAPEELTSIANFGGPATSAEVHVVFDGDDPELAARAIDPIRGLGTVIGDDVALKPYADVLVDGMALPPGLDALVRSGFTGGASVPAALRILTEAGAAPQPPLISVRSVGGAVSRVPADATAYAHRQAELMVVTLAAGPPPVVETLRPAFEETWTRLAPHVSGAYGNFLASATEADVAAIYPGPVHERLAAVKRRCDPGNLFARNHNIRP